MRSKGTVHVGVVKNPQFATDSKRFRALRTISPAPLDSPSCQLSRYIPLILKQIGNSLFASLEKRNFAEFEEGQTRTVQCCAAELVKKTPPPKLSFRPQTSDFGHVFPAAAFRNTKLFSIVGLRFAIILLCGISIYRCFGKVVLGAKNVHNLEVSLC